MKKKGDEISFRDEFDNASWSDYVNSIPKNVKNIFSHLKGTYTFTGSYLYTKEHSIL